MIRFKMYRKLLFAVLTHPRARSFEVKRLGDENFNQIVVLIGY